MEKIIVDDTKELCVAKVNIKFALSANACSTELVRTEASAGNQINAHYRHL